MKGSACFYSCASTAGAAEMILFALRLAFNATTLALRPFNYVGIPTPAG
jgi:hypothetical protein